MFLFIIGVCFQSYVTVPTFRW